MFIVHCKLTNNIKDQEKTWSGRTYSQLEIHIKLQKF